MQTVRGIWKLWDIGCEGQGPLKDAFTDKFAMKRKGFNWQADKMKKQWGDYKGIVWEILEIKKKTSVSDEIIVNKLTDMQKSLNLTILKFALCISAVHCSRDGRPFTYDMKRLGDFVPNFVETYSQVFGV